MARMRDKVIHVYFGIDYRRIWETVRDAIPTVYPQIESLLEEVRFPQNDQA
jgi:uncharacterized protein with HEPN domain